MQREWRREKRERGRERGGERERMTQFIRKATRYIHLSYAQMNIHSLSHTQTHRHTHTTQNTHTQHTHTHNTNTHVPCGVCDLLRPAKHGMLGSDRRGNISRSDS